MTLNLYIDNCIIDKSIQKILKSISKSIILECVIKNRKNYTNVYRIFSTEYLVLGEATKGVRWMPWY